jgi:tetratricopeptide (TPR) repeat protein
LAAAYEKTGQRKKARTTYLSVLQLCQALQAADPNNEEDLHTMASVYQNLSRLSEEHGLLPDALRNWRAMVEVEERLAQLYSNKDFLTSVLAADYFSLAVLIARSAGAQFENGVLVRPEANIKSLAHKDEWKEAKETFEKSFRLYEQLKTEGLLSGAYVNKPEQIRAEIAKCDAML